jgi:ribonucleoside-diphosphate reductase beta chain
MLTKVPQFLNLKGDDRLKGMFISNYNVERLSGTSNLNRGDYAYLIETWINEALNLFWRPEEISMTEDKKQFQELPKEVQDAYSYVISFLTYLDSIVPRNTKNLLQVLIHPEVETALFVHGFIEAGIHRVSYQYILSSIFPKEEVDKIYYKFKDYKPLLERNYKISRDFQTLQDLIYKGIISEDIKDSDSLEQLAKWNKETFQRTVFRAMVQDFFLEGVVFFVGFNFFHYLAFKQGVMQGTNQQIMQIRFDEVLHLPLFKYILHRWRDEGYYFEEDEVYEIAEKSAMADIVFYNEAVADRLPLLTKRNIDDYIKHLTDERLKYLGLRPIFNVSRNPFSDIDKLLYQDKASFFETGNVDYKQVNVRLEDIDNINFDVD